MTQDNGTGSAGTSGRMRASDAERERTIEQLREHFGAGRLDPEEFNERMEAAFAARFRDELPALLADLPSGGIGQEQAPAGAGDRLSGPGPGWGGPPPWHRAAFAGRWAWRRGPFVPILPLLLVLAMVGSIGAIAHGHFPFPLLWVGVALWWFRPWSRRRPRNHGGRSDRATSGASAARV